MAEFISPPGDIRLSEHFWLSEFLRSSAADRIPDRIDHGNMPTEEHLANLRETAASLETVRAYIGGRRIRISSGYRNRVVNADVGGTESSAHPHGWAGDLEAEGMTDFQLATKLAEGVRSGALKVDQLIYEVGRTVHWGVRYPRTGGQRGQIKTQRGGPGSPLADGIKR